MRKLTTLLLFGMLLALFPKSHGQTKPKKIPSKYTSNMKVTVDPFTGVETFNYARPTYMYVERDGEKVAMFLKIAVRRATTQPEIRKILIRANGEIFEIVRNDRDFRTREISDTKDTYDENTKVVKQRNAERIYIDEFIGNIDDYPALFDALFLSKALVRIEGNVEIADQEIDKWDHLGGNRLHTLYKYLQAEKP